MKRNTKKHDVADKVKEIKQRQQNWMKQRAQTQNVASPVTQSVTLKEENVHNPSRWNHGDKIRDSDPLQQVRASKKSQAKFQNWLKAKEVTEDTSVDDFYADNYETVQRRGYKNQQYVDNHYQDSSYRDHHGSNEVNVLQVPSNRTPGFASPDPQWDSDNETREITVLSPDQFDSVADSIIARVKGEMGIKSNISKTKSSTLHQGRQNECTSGKSVSLSKSKGLHQSVTSSSSSSEMSSHVCPICGKVMLPPDNSPSLLIPCGHTICTSCSRRVKFCCICSCAVQNTTANIMLEQIISNFFKQQQATDKGHHQSKSQAFVNEKNLEEMENLETRREILMEESDNISRSIRQISLKLRDKHEQVEQVLAEEQEVHESINKLQQKLASLQQQRKNYEDKCDEIQQHSAQEKQRLALVKESIKSLQHDMEKLNMSLNSRY